jgi:DNA recombination protein RmuC
MSQHLHNLIDTHKALQGETRNLVQALRRPEVRGRWGELTLRRLVELAGLAEHCDFSEQPAVRTTTGHVRPDLIVHMPGGRDVVIDAKTPLDAYLSAIEAGDDATRDAHLKRHAAQLRARIRELAAKAYWELLPRSTDFVVLFVPGDQFLSAALDKEPELLEQALAERVILAAPGSLVALLRTVAYGWRQEQLTRNADEIRSLAEELYRRLGTFSEHLSQLGRHLDQSVAQFNRLVGSFDSKVLPAARRFATMGVSSKKTVERPEPVETRPRHVADEGES